MTGSLENFNKALIASILGHILTVGVAILISNYRPSQFMQPMIYSVTIEGGKTLGGRTQAPKDEKSQVAPPKNVEEPTKKPPEKKAVQEEEKKVVEKTKPKDAEVSLKPKEKKKEEPKKVVKAAAKPTPVPKPKELSQAEMNKKIEQAMQRYTGESAAAGGSGFGAAKLGGKGMGGGTIRPPEFFAYLRTLEQHIKAGWSWYDPNADLRTQVRFQLSPEGEITGITVDASSGRREFDDSVLRAVKKANPAPAPPSSVYEYFKDVRVTFDPRD